VSEGTVGRALAWSLVVAVFLLAWPWFLAWLQRWRPAWLAGIPAPALGDLQPHALRRGALGPRRVAAWVALAAAASLLPASRSLVAADLDAGVLWLAALAVLALLWDRGRCTATAASALLTLVLCLLPVILRTASLNLADLAIAQQGGAGNWFLLRDPFLLLAAVVYLLAVATLWPKPRAAVTGGPAFLVEHALRAGLPLVLAHLFVVVFLGGWWAFAVFLDGASLLNTVLKVVAVLVVLVLLRRRPAWVDRGNLWRVLPAAGVVCAVGSLFWMTITGAAP
jgi:hypothetical protein